MIKTLAKNGKTINYKIINKKNKHTYFHFKDELLVVTKNSRMSNEKILQLINDQFDLIYQKISSKIKVNSDEFLLFGKKLNLIINESLKFSYSICDDKIIINLPSNYDLRKTTNFIYKELLTNKISELTAEVSTKIKMFGLSLVPFKIKDVKSYHGKCFIDRKYIVFALHLAKLNQEFLEYIIYHEYAHFIEPNHSQKFYRVLGKMFPNYQEIQKKLKKIKL